MNNHELAERVKEVHRWLYQATLHQDLTGSLDTIDNLEGIIFQLERNAERHKW